MQTKRVRAVVTGMVQGVGFRFATQRQADRLRLSGWVRNRPDGSVEIEVEGDGDVVDTFLAWCAQGPPGAHVNGVETETQATSGAVGTFEIQH